MSDKNDNDLKNEMEEWKNAALKDIDELIARHKATLDLLAKPAPSKPVECGCLDKAEIIKALERNIKTEKENKALATRNEWFNDAGRAVNREYAFRAVKELVEAGDFDRAPCKPAPISTANLVEQLRSQANLADGIDVTDLDADQLLTVGWNRPATVIMVRKEDRS